MWEGRAPGRDTSWELTGWWEQLCGRDPRQQAGCEPAVCPTCKGGQRHPGLHHHMHNQWIKESDDVPLYSVLVG